MKTKTSQIYLKEEIGRWDVGNTSIWYGRNYYLLFFQMDENKIILYFILLSFSILN